MKKKLYVLVLLAATSHLFAQDHGPHVHGAGNLQINLSEHELYIELSIPGADFIGFEHSELTGQEETALREKIKAIEGSENLILFRTRLSTVVKQVEVEVHKEEEHGEHGDEEEHKEHSEYIVSFRYSFDKASNLKSADFKGLFDAFPTLEDLDWVLVSEEGQKAGELSPRKSKLNFR